MNETKSPYMQQSRHDDGIMTREQAIKWVKFVHDVLYEDKDEEIREALNMAIEALSQPIVCKDYRIDDDHIYCSPKMADRVVKALQDRPSGEWTYLSGSKGSYMTISCPICGSTFNDVAEWKYNFCPNCGARMKGGDDE